MAFVVSIEIKRQFEVDCSFKKAFALLSDVPASVSYFPDVDQLVDLGGGAYRWEMKKIGIDRYHIQTVYACKYKDDAEKGVVKWTPVKGEGNAAVKGRWSLKPLDKKRTLIKLSTAGDLEVPLPRLVKLVAAPIVAREFEGLVDRYIENLTETLESKKKGRRKKG